MTRDTYKLPKQALDTIAAIDQFVRTTSISKALVALVKLRVSQMNGCSYCVDLHAKEALEEGTSARKLHAVVLWRVTPFFDEIERAALELAESVTLLGSHEAHGSVEKARNFLGDELLTGVLMTAISINAWNRVGVPLGMTPALEG